MWKKFEAPSRQCCFFIFDNWSRPWEEWDVWNLTKEQINLIYICRCVQYETSNSDSIYLRSYILLQTVCFRLFIVCAINKSVLWITCISTAIIIIKIWRKRQWNKQDTVLLEHFKQTDRFYPYSQIPYILIHIDIVNLRKGKKVMRTADS